MIKLIGIPFDANSSYLLGAAKAPEKIREIEKCGASNTFSEYGVDIQEGNCYTDCGDISFPTEDRETCFNIIKDYVFQATGKDNKIICFGGDHSVTYPVVDALAEKYQKLNILHFDAHADLYDNFDNNPYSHASPFARILEKRKEITLIQVGIRTLNTHQREQAKRFNVRIIEMKDFNEDFLFLVKGPLYISLDLDALDPAYVPGISHHEPGGLSVRQVISIIQQIKVPVIGADIVEYNPTRDNNDITAMVAYKLFKEIVAKMTEQ